MALAAEVLEEVETGDGIVIIHAPPATVSAATLVWARVADVTILGVRRFQARRSMIEDVAVNLRAVDANLAFSVLHERYRPSEVRAAAPIDAPLDPEPAAAPTTGARRASLETVATDGTSGGGAGESTSPRRRTRPAPSTSGTWR